MGRNFLLVQSPESEFFFFFFFLGGGGEVGGGVFFFCNQSFFSWCLQGKV